MKKLVFAVLAIGAMAACTKVSVQHEEPGEISLQPVTTMSTRVVSSTSYPTEVNFKVWAWHGAADASATPSYAGYTTEYINEGEFAWRDNKNWGGYDSAAGKNQPYYWPTTGSLIFAGYSPAGATATSFAYDVATQKFTAEGYTQSNQIAGMNDLMWFDVDKSYSANPGTSDVAKGVPVVFHHALSWLTFKFNLKEEIASTSWTIKSVILTNIELKANFTSKPEGTSPGWTNHDVRGEISVYNNPSNTAPVSYNSGEVPLLNGQKDGVVVIPQLCVDGTDHPLVPDPAPMLVITYDLVSPAGNTLTGQEVTLPLTTTNDPEDTSDDDNWLPGKHYTYTIIFGANEILISPTVASWTEVTETVNVENN